MILQDFEAELTNLSNLQHLRYRCDTDADLALSAIQRQLQNRSETQPLRHRNDLYSVFGAGSRVDPVLAKLWSDVNSVPEWVDWSQLERGQRVFHRYILASITGFILQGFIGENSAASGVVEVLVLTGGFDPKNLTRRLKETFRWLLEVTSDLESIQPGGKGHADTIRVRLLHAQVRQRVLALAERKPGYYDSAKYGLPINTLDSVHSISTFCCSPMWSQLPKMGIHPTEDEIKDYIALFRYLGHLLGVPQALFDTTARAQKIMQAMMEQESQPTATSQTVARNFIQTITSTRPHKLSNGFVAAGASMRIHCTTPLFTAVVGSQLLYVTFKDLTSRRALNRIFVEPEATSSAELPFIFRFIPALSPSTTDEKNAKHTSTLRLAVDAENMFRAVFVFYVCVVGSLSLAGVWAFHRAVRSNPMVGV
ncbi:hypothetical protein Q7P35_008987 [Cladosporium inversicolor]